MTLWIFECGRTSVGAAARQARCQLVRGGLTSAGSTLQCEFVPCLPCLRMLRKFEIACNMLRAAARCCRPHCPACRHGPLLPFLWHQGGQLRLRTHPKGAGGPWEQGTQVQQPGGAAACTAGTPDTRPSGLATGGLSESPRGEHAKPRANITCSLLPHPHPAVPLLLHRRAVPPKLLLHL